MAMTAEQAKNRLRQNGETIKAWAEKHGFPVTCVRAVLNGHNRGNYGQSHKIALALGIKDRAK